MKTASALVLLIGLIISFGVFANNPFDDLDQEEYGVHITMELNVIDYAAVNSLSNTDPTTLRVLITTESLSPDANLYGIAEALAEGIKRKYKMAEFRVFGRVNNVELAKSIRTNYDLVFVVGSNAASRDYDYDETVYGSRTSGVRCSKSSFNDSVECRESGSESMPIGTRKSQRTIFTDTFFVNYGDKACASWNADFTIPGLTVCSPIGHMAVTMRYGQSDASWCANSDSAQATLARMTGDNVVSSRPERISVTTSPDEIGCEE
jgi:hypothetical protein